MQAIKVNDGKSFQYDNDGGAIAAGDVVAVGPIAGIAMQNIAAASTGEVAMRGIFDIVKEAAVEVSTGAIVYWHAAGHANVTEMGSACIAGLAVKDAAGADATVRVILVSL